MNTYQPYIYLVGWSKHDRWYIGTSYKRGCHPSDLWTTYFTSSRYVTAFRYLYGEPDVVRSFPVPDKEAALVREDVVQFYCDAVKSDRYLNRGRGGHKFKAPGGPCFKRRGQKVTGAALKNVRASRRTPEYRAKLSQLANDPVRKTNLIARNKARKGEQRSGEALDNLRAARANPAYRAQVRETNRKKARTIDFNGTKVSVADIAEMIDRDKGFVRRRLAEGMTVAEVIECSATIHRKARN